MKIAVTDACIFIDIHELKLTPSFFSLPLDVHTTIDVYNELFDEHKQFLTAFISVGKLTLHTLSEDQRITIHRGDYPRSLSENDKSVIYLADVLDAILLSSDKAVRIYAKKKAIEHHGMLWLFDKFIETQIFSKKDAIIKLHQLVTGNLIYQNNEELMQEVNKRIRSWGKP
ncbi:MAG: hypothetical protein ABI480_01765 [Chitinophagaceae bacterium]